MNIIVHTKPNCPQCEATKHELTRLGLPFTVTPINEASRARFIAAGLRMAPAVEIDGEIAWGGFDRARLLALADAQAEHQGAERPRG